VLDPAQVGRSLALDGSCIGRVRTLWLELAAIAVFGALQALREAALAVTVPRANEWAALLDQRGDDEDNPPSDPTG
jgi:hypothetical protein